MANQYDTGDVFRSKVEFRRVSDNGLQDPTTIRVLRKKPDGTTQTLIYGVDGSVIKESIGVYYCDFTLDIAGSHFHRWEGTGAVIAAGQGRVVALRPMA